MWVNQADVKWKTATRPTFRSWCNHCLKGRGSRSALKRRHSEGEGVDDRAVTTYSIDCMYLTEEGREDEVNAEEGAARGSTTLG